MCLRDFAFVEQPAVGMSWLEMFTSLASCWRSPFQRRNVGLHKGGARCAAIDVNCIVAGGYDQRAALYDSVSGAQRWEYVSNAVIASVVPSAHIDRVFVSTKNGQVVALYATVLS
jgi:hypothetical protein